MCLDMEIYILLQTVNWTKLVDFHYRLKYGNKTHLNNANSWNLRSELMFLFVVFAPVGQ